MNAIATPERRAFGRRVAVLYAAGAAAWIFGSDMVVIPLVSGTDFVAAASMIKGSAFVGITGLILYLFITRNPRIAFGIDAVPPGAARGAAWRQGPLPWFVLLALALMGSVLWLFLQQDEFYRTQALLQTGARAEVKAHEIGTWLKERAETAQSYRGARFLQDDLAAMKHGDAAAKARVELRMEEIRRVRGLESILVLDAAGESLASAGRLRTAPPELARDAQDVARTRKERLHLLRRAPPGITVALDQIVPIEHGTAAGAAPAVLILRDAAESALFPMLQRWPVPIRSGEAYLVRQQGGRVEYLSERRRDLTAALNPDPALAEVISASRPVAGTDWRVVAKVDIDEVLEPARMEAWQFVPAMLGLTLLAALGAVMLWRQQTQLSRLREHALATEREVMSRHLDLLSRFANDIILLVDDDGDIVEANDKACERYGYTRAELIGMPAQRLRAASAPDSIAKRLAEVELSGGRIFESLHVTRSGKEFPTEISARRIRVDGADYVQAIIRDITERKRAQAALIESEERFRAVLEQPIVAVYVIQDGKLVYVNPRMREIFGYPPEGEFNPDPLAHIAPHEHARVMEQMTLRLREEAQAAYSVAALRRDGTPFTLGLHATRAAYNGKPAIIAIAQDITEKTRAEEEIQRFVARLKRAVQSTIEVVSTIGELRDPYTHGHERRVGEIAVAMAAELGLPEDQREGIRVAGYLHDVGKIAVPAEILSKPTRLSKAEFDLVKQHSQQSYEILKNVDFPWPVAEAAWQHHERMDGTGYPRGLKGEEIILEARILAVADVVEAMASHRPYRPGLGIDKALAEIERGRGTAYDPLVADACLRLFREKNFKLPD